MNAKNSLKIDDIEVNFKPKVEAFIKALQDGGATVKVKATKRNKKRAYLFHWSWKISLGKCKAADATMLAGVELTGFMLMMPKAKRLLKNWLPDLV